jgi:hypothetical protein
MDEFLNLIRLAIKDIEAPVIIRYCKEFGQNGKKTLTVEGPYSAITASLCELITEAIKKNPDRIMQRFTLELLYVEVMRELGFSKE